ncbi:MAG: hypothetical protein RI902_2240 [Pseudomonadota bacterium]|jgi:hypothetical protein
MYLVLIAWFYVALMMAVAEATSPVGTVLGAVFTFLLYGALPMVVVGYIMGTPARKRARLKREAAENSDANSMSGANSADIYVTNSTAQSTVAPDASCESTGDAIAPVRKEP